MNSQHIQASFVISAVAPPQFPADDTAEVAFIGRSNVGKSSLLNLLVRHSNLARVSNTPGKTREINFFSTNAGFRLVDLPGYGYARVSKVMREQFQSLMLSYLRDRGQLCLVFALIDARRDPMPADLAIIEELEIARRPYVLALTKIDKISEHQLSERMQQLRQVLHACKYFIDLIPTSARSGQGRLQLLAIIRRVGAETELQ